VILTRQTCSQRSSRAAESKRQALENYFPERICYILPMLKCRGDSDIGLSALFGYLRRENRCAMATSEKNVFRLQEKSEIGIAQRFSFRKYPQSAPT